MSKLNINVMQQIEIQFQSLASALGLNMQSVRLAGGWC
jgi:hypothetical protein